MRGGRVTVHAGFVIQPLPPNTLVWYVGDFPKDGTITPEGPFEALYIGFGRETFQASSDEWTRQMVRRNAKGEAREYTEVQIPDWAGDFLDRLNGNGGMDFWPVYVFIKADWECPWVAMREHAFWTEAGARDMADERNKANRAAGGADATA
jgi:hypothetical protein